MRIVLASQGFTTPEIARAVADLVGKSLSSLNVAVINEAYTGIAAGRHEGWLIDELSFIRQHVRGNISFVNLRAYDIAEIEQRLEFADLIYIVGGAQLVLPRLFQESGFDNLLRNISAKKVIMGTSAGANVLGAHIEDANYWQDQYDGSPAYVTERSLGLVDFNILPHFEREDRPRRNVEILTPLLKDSPFPLYGLTDTQAVIHDNGKIRFVGGNPVQFGAGLGA